MLHWKISNSLQVNKLSLPARILFTWMIAHADDDGRIKGEAEYIKGKVIPMTEYTAKEVESMLQEITGQQLICRWEENNNIYIEFPTWLDHQQIRKNRYKKSNIPRFDNQWSSNVQPAINHRTSQSNVIKSNKVKISKSEWNNTSRNKTFNPKTYKPENKLQHVAFELWKRLEPDNPRSFDTTYLNAVIHGVPDSLLYEFASEIEQDNSIGNKGAVFNSKVQDWIDKKYLSLLQEG